MHPQLNIAIKAARAAGDYLIQTWERLERNTLVGARADVTAERIIFDHINKAYPEHLIYTAASNEKIADDDPQELWLVSPITGLLNFIHKVPHFAVSVAMRQNNTIQHGVIYDPFKEELFTATKRDGAQCNGKRMRVAAEYNNLELAMVAVSADKLSTKIKHNIRCTGNVAMDLAYVAAGRFDGCCVTGNIWELAAGSLFVQEAGGFISGLQEGTVVAGTRKLYPLLQDL